MADFIEAYVDEHRHYGIGFHTPADVHFGLTTDVDHAHREAMHTAWQIQPQRFGKHHRPKTLELPGAAWISQTTEPTQEGT